VFLAVAVVVVGVSASAFGATTITLDRVTNGLDAYGNFIPGTSQLSFTVTLTLGGDMETVTALAVEETLPAGWTFAGGAPTGNAPNLYPDPGDTSPGAFVWFSIPTFPATFTYTVNVPADVVAPVSVTGKAIFRTGAGELLSDTIESIVKNSIVAERTVVGSVGPGGAYYRPGTTLDVTVVFTRTFTDTLTALGVSDEMPDGWMYVNGSVGVNAGNTAPNLTQFAGQILSFAWFSLPTFPLTLTYQIEIASDAAGDDKCLNGIALYRTGGPELTSNEFNVCLDEEPCLSLERVVPSQCYAAGQDLTVNITLTSNCVSSITALGLAETLPADWTFVSATGGDIKPAAGATGELSFAWFSIPAFPYTFSYIAHVPDPQEDDKIISGQAIYRLSGGELRTFLVDTVVCGADLVPPEITIEGENPVTVECGDAYADAGATALDNVDGDITDQIVTVNNVPDPTAVGDYTVTYNVCDAATNCAPEATRVVHVVDTTIPVITMNGSNMTVECGAAYNDAGASAADTCDAEVPVIVNNPVNSSVPGVYTVTYNATDDSGNAAVEVTRTVTVEDTTPPLITLVGQATMGVECGGTFTDPGFGASDVCVGSVAVIVGGDTVNPDVPGTYVITYDATDGTNSAAQVTRTVNVGDTTDPVITINGDAVVNLCVGDGYTDAGASVTDICDASVTLNTDNPVNPNAVGSYTVTYSATDASGNAAMETRTVNVADCEPPEITLVGDSSVVVECGGSYDDAGATASDNVDGDLTANIVPNSTVNTAAVGSYQVTYNVSDTAGNVATPVIRTVFVQDTTVPVITLTGDAAVTVECGANYVDAGATAADACDGVLTVQVDNPVNTAVTGDYTVTYTVCDNAGNCAAPVTRLVTVTDTVAPVITLNGDVPAAVECGGVYTEAGASAEDTCDGTVDVTIGGDTVDPAVPGDYIVTYAAVDVAGNTADATRTVTVADTTDPVVTVTGDNPQTICTVDSGGGYVELNATANDSCDGDPQIVSDAITMVDDNTPGTYTVTYTATDAAGNQGTAARTVIVEDCTIEGEEGEGGEGEGEGGEGEGEVDCGGCVLEIAITSPTGNIVVPMGANALVNLASAVTFANADCETHRVQVVYSIDGTAVAVSTDRTSGFAATTTLVSQTEAYVLTAVVRDIETGCTAEAEVEFNVQPGTDEDNNGLPDNPFTQLPNDGDRWDAVVDGANCPRAISMVSWMNAAGADVILTVVRPDDETQSVTVTVPRGLISAGEQGIAIVSISCDLISLLGAAESAKVAAEPENLVAGGVPFQVSIITSSDGGVNFTELNGLEQPVGIVLNGLAFSPGLNATFFDHPSDITKDTSNRVQITIPAGGDWSSDFVDNPEAAAGALTAETSQLSVFEPFEVSPMGPTLSVSPNPAYDFIVGIVQVDGSVTNVLKVKNIGGGTLTGAATLSDPSGAFSIVGAANYSLTFGQTAVVTVKFSPAKTGDFTAALTFSNTSVTPTQQLVATLRGTGSAKAKVVSVFGCSPSSGSGSGMGDLAVMGIALAGLLALGRTYRRSRQS